MAIIETHSGLPSPEDPSLSPVLESLGLGVPEVSQEGLVFAARRSRMRRAHMLAFDMAYFEKVDPSPVKGQQTPTYEEPG